MPFQGSLRRADVILGFISNDVICEKCFLSLRVLSTLVKIFEMQMVLKILLFTSTKLSNLSVDS